jgi:hypothetical protein
VHLIALITFPLVVMVAQACMTHPCTCRFTLCMCTHRQIECAPSDALGNELPIDEAASKKRGGTGGGEAGPVAA